MTKQSQRFMQLFMQLCSLWLLGSGLQAHAAPPRAPESIHNILGDLSWGMNPDTLLHKRATEVTDTRRESFLRDEIGQRTGELVTTSRDAFGRWFYVFVAGKLSRLYLGLDALTFPEGNFAAFTAGLERRFGPARRAQGELSPRTRRSWLEWRADRSRLRAIDETQHGGFYCLILENLATVDNVRLEP
jgi:hypothetical protein